MRIIEQVCFGLLCAALAGCGGTEGGSDSGGIDGAALTDAGSDADGGSSSGDAGRDAQVSCTTDEDGDGYLAASCGGDDCDDSNAGRHPGLAELCNSVDEDCEISTLGPTDEDADGFVSNTCCNTGLDGNVVCGPDCDDSDNAVSPDDAEVCDGADNDCDGMADDPPAGDECALPAATAMCSGGACTVGACDTSFEDCDGTASNGCEADTRSSLTHCGGCDQPCDMPNASDTCNGGTCTLGTCLGGFADCNAGAGCETPTNTLTDCGTCGNPCSLSNGTATCASGTCQLAGCNPGYNNCDGVDANGCEPLNTLTNCGSCGAGCMPPNAGNYSCSTGSCVLTSCTSGYCNGDTSVGNGCETDLETNPACTSAPATALINVDGDSADTSGLVATGTGEMAFRAVINETNTDGAGDPACEDKGARFTLRNTGSAIYNATIHCGSCTGTSVDLSYITPVVMGMRDLATCNIAGADTDQSLTLFIEIELIASTGTMCSGWEITATPDVTTGATYCP